jgi:muramidase (phage lysozyme)
LGYDVRREGGNELNPDPKILAFLNLIAWSEGTSTSPSTRDNGYDVIVSGIGGPNTFTDYSTHPFANGRPPIVVNHSGLESTASGRYQQVLRNWTVYKVQLNLPDFGHDSQDAMALQLLKECHAEPLILAGNVAAAISACSSRWASFPGHYQQGNGPHSIPDLVAQYNSLASGTVSA